ncbi:hypothetical protein NCT2020_1850 [Enterobacter phage vB_EkoM5VN]|uniref:Uncharacterized protein n=1 Tax=Enterobacter phage vB_EkoM5VN TaxID=2771379 RepID=A0A7I8HNK8_9CAUD|nr:hypothetical protein NCT2020_1850 [Enterobacter phage vB_EkoM5VN]
MIYTVECLVDCEPGNLICASDTILDCINAVNNHETFPYVADDLEFIAWKDGKKVAVAVLVGNRVGDTIGANGYEPNPVTYEEVIGKMVLE